MTDSSGSGTTTSTRPQPGVHLVEWGCELLGTAILLIGGLSAVCLDFGSHSPIAAHLHSTSARLLLTGLLFPGVGSLVALSPIGRRSGAHLNPAVTLGFWCHRKVHPHDLAGYVVAQLVGALVGTAVVLGLWGARARSVTVGVTSPGHGLDGVEAMLVEAGMTAALVLVVLVFTSSASTMRWTPLVTWLLVAGFVWQVAPYTGTSLNPARSFGPAVIEPRFASFWVYVVGPLAGALLAVAVNHYLPTHPPVTTKLFHDPSYPTTMAASVPVARRVRRAGRSARSPRSGTGRRSRRGAR